MVAHLTGSMGKNSTVHNLTLELDDYRLNYVDWCKLFNSTHCTDFNFIIGCSIWILNQKTYDVASGDFRFLIVPVAIFATGALTFTTYSQHFTIKHTISKFRIEFSTEDWEPMHQGMSYSFRPEIVSVSPLSSYFLPVQRIESFLFTLILLGCCYSIQHLAERYSSKNLDYLGGNFLLFSCCSNIWSDDDA